MKTLLQFSELFNAEFPQKEIYSDHRIIEEHVSSGNSYCGGIIVIYLRIQVKEGRGINGGDWWPWVLVRDGDKYKLFSSGY